MLDSYPYWRGYGACVAPFLEDPRGFSHRLFPPSLAEEPRGSAQRLFKAFVADIPSRVAIVSELLEREGLCVPALGRAAVARLDVSLWPWLERQTGDVSAWVSVSGFLHDVGVFAGECLVADTGGAFTWQLRRSGGKRMQHYHLPGLGLADPLDLWSPSPVLVSDGFYLAMTLRDPTMVRFSSRLLRAYDYRLGLARDAGGGGRDSAPAGG